MLSSPTVPTSVSLNTPVTGTANSGEVKYYNFPFHSSGITFRLDVLQGSIIAYASDVTDAPNTQRGYVWQIQTSSYDDLFFNPSSLGRRPGNIAYIAVEGRNSFNSFSVGAVSENRTTTGQTLSHACTLYLTIPMKHSVWNNSAYMTVWISNVDGGLRGERNWHNEVC